MTRVCLSEVAEINPRGDRLAPDVEVSFVGMAELDAETAVARPLALRPYSDVSKGYTPFRNGDLLAAKITPCWENGKVGIAQLDTESGAGSTEFHVIRPSEQIDHRYLLHFLRRPEVRATGTLRMTGSGGQRRVPVRYLEELELDLPPLREQRRVAEILDRASHLVSQRRRTVELLRPLEESIFHSMFAHREFPTASLADAVRDGTQVTYGIVQAGPDTEGGVPYIRTGDISGGEIRTNGLLRTSKEIASRFSRSTVESGDIVMSIRATVGTTAVVPPTLSGANLTQGTARIAPSERVQGPYLLGLLRSAPVQRWVQSQVKGATFREITLSRLRELSVPVPPIELQHTYALRTQQIAQTRSRALSALGVLEEQRHALQSSAFRGEL